MLTRLVLIAGLLLASCAAPAPARDGDLVVALLGEPASLFADDPSARVLRAAVTETLVVQDATDRPVARLAAEVPTLANGDLEIVFDDEARGGRLVATFRLRPDAVWHDGAPVTAEDVRFAWEQDRGAPERSEARLLAERIDRVEVISSRTARVVYAANERWDGYALAPRVLPRHLLADASEAARAEYEREPMHAGPFEITAWDRGIGLTLSAFDGYVLGRPGLERILVRFFDDRSALLAALGRGEVDVVPAPVLEADLVRTLDRVADGTDRTGLQTYYTPAQAVETLHFGDRFADRALRRAVELALDRQAIVDTVLAGRARVPRTYLVPPGWAALDLGVAPPPDRALARAHLASAGYAPGPFGIMERDGVRLLITIGVERGSTARLDAARIVAGQLAAVGIAAETSEVAPGDLGAALRSGAFDLAVAREPAGDPQLATERYVGRAGPWFDALARAAAAAVDQAERRALYAELQRAHLEAVASIPLYQYLAIDVAPRRLAGVHPASHLAPLTWNVHEWRFTP